MGILILESHQNIGYVIKKNPATGMIKRVSRFCEMSGFYKKNDISKYMIYGRDFDGCSFGFESRNYSKNENKYLNPCIYSSSTFPIIAITEFFDSVLKKEEPSDIKYNHKIVINALSLNKKNADLMERLAKYFDHIKLTIDDKNTYKKFTFTCDNTSLHYMLNIIVVLMTIIAGLNNETINISDSFAEKIVQCANRCDSPYFIRYFLASRILCKSDFDKLKPLLEKSSKNLKLNHGMTSQHRKVSIEKLLSFKNAILDVGCGEGAYLLPFSKKLKELKYVGFDIDENEIQGLRSKVDKLENKNVVLYTDIDAAMEECGNELYDVIITEVIEHMELSSVIPFIQNVLDNINYDSVIITTPNRDFNVNYMMEKEFRHFDHKWEISKDEFVNQIKKLNIKEIFNVSFIDIGDIVDGISCTIGCVIKKS